MRREKFVPGHVHAVSSPEENVIDGPFAPIIQTDSHLLADWIRRDKGTSQVYRHIFESVHQPTCSCRSDRSFSELVLEPSRETPKQIGSRHQLTNACGPNVSGSIEKTSGEFAQPMMQCLGSPSLEPMNVTGTRDDFNFGSAFMQQSCRLQGALSAADDQNPFPGKPFEVTVFR